MGLEKSTLPPRDRNGQNYIGQHEEISIADVNSYTHAYYTDEAMGAANTGYIRRNPEQGLVFYLDGHLFFRTQTPEGEEASHHLYTKADPSNHRVLWHIESTDRHVIPGTTLPLRQEFSVIIGQEAQVALSDTFGITGRVTATAAVSGRDFWSLTHDTITGEPTTGEIARLVNAFPHLLNSQ